MLRNVSECSNAVKSQVGDSLLSSSVFVSQKLVFENSLHTDF